MNNFAIAEYSQNHVDIDEKSRPWISVCLSIFKKISNAAMSSDRRQTYQPVLEGSSIDYSTTVLP